MSNNPTDIVNFKILVGGSAIDDTVEVVEAHLNFALNRIASAKLVINDGNPAQDTFEISSGHNFVPRNEIEIQAGCGNEIEPIFKGIIISQSIHGNYSSRYTLIVECRDKALKMTLGRKSGSFVKKSDSEVMVVLASRNGIPISVNSTKTEWEHLSNTAALIGTSLAHGPILTAWSSLPPTIN